MTISKFLSTAAIIFSLTILGAEAKPPAGSDATNHVNKGVELAQQHKYDEAIKEFTAAIAGEPEERQGLLEPRHGLSRVAEIRRGDGRFRQGN